MRITWKWVIAIPMTLVMAPVWVLLVTNPMDFLEDRRFLVFPFVAFLFCGLAAIFSYVVHVLDDRKHLKTRFFFFGQVAAAVLVIGLFTYKTISQKIYEDTQANIDANIKLINFAYDAGEGRVRALLALNQLEAKFDNKNDVRLLDVESYRLDTIVNDRLDFVTVFYFEYTDKYRPGENMYSKHLLGYHIQAMVFYDVPVEALPEIKRKKEEEARQAMEGLKEMEEVIKNLRLDTVLQAP